MAKQITIKCGKSKNKYASGVTAADVAKDKKIDALAASVNDKLVDLSTKIRKDSEIIFVTYDTHEGKEIFHHSTAHLMAQAVIKLYPKALPTIGPTIEGGFYYDFDHSPFSPSDLKGIEKEMRKIVTEKLEVKRKQIPYKEALKLFKKNKYKIELIKEFEKEGKKVSVYQQGKFIDLCRGPHIPNTSYLKAFKLTKVSSAYWRADSKKDSLQRIYGVSFPKESQLKNYLRLKLEAAKRDHRKIGKELDLFSFHEEGTGFPFWHNKGMIIWDEVMNYMKAMLKKNNYQEVRAPLILNKELWLKSGHWDHYKNNMYFTLIDGQEHAVKPMNCPGHILIYKNSIHSYRDLPIRMGEFGLVHRHEMSGVLAGLFRVRSFTQDDAHVFCTEDQLKDEIKKLIDFVTEVYSTFGFKDYQIELSTKPQDSMGSDDMWKNAENALSAALKEKKIDYKINPGDGAFYGPKIDFHIKDCMGRSWQCGTIQVDFSMPERFDLTYEGKNNKKHRPVMLHRAILGSMERFIGIMIEHYAGKMPAWLSPVQVKIITVADRFNKYAEGVKAKLEEEGVRVEVDNKKETIGRKVREAQIQKINYILTVGEKEEKTKTIAVRTRDNKVKMGVKPDKFLKDIVKEIKEKR
ncbi:threonine--tRNA ligase [Candidatus Woesearchaeota archaeon]|nr:threonine--tRNA ligase [Candidatus Woesearchaeota archaeon]